MSSTTRNTRAALRSYRRSVERGIGRVMTTLPAPLHVRPARLLVVSGLLAAALLAGCGSDSTTAPSTGNGGVGGGGGGGGGGGAAPGSAAVNVGDIFFKSAKNGTSNAAVDTVVVGGSVTWTWATGETLPHSVQSLGSPSFASSGIQSGSGKSYQVTFPTAGTYQYDCAVHGKMMTGTIVVQAAASPTPAPGGPTYP